MATDAHFTAINLHFRRAGDKDHTPIREGYVLLLIADDDSPEVEALQRWYPPAVLHVRIDGKPFFRVQARTNANGWLMAASGSVVTNPKSLDGMGPLMLPMGLWFHVWWTDDEEIFDDILEHSDEEDRDIPPEHMAQVGLYLNASDPLPPVIERRIQQIGDSPDEFKRDPRDVFPAHVFELVEEERTLSIVLEDHTLDLATDLAYRMRDARGIRQQVPPHQALANLACHIVDTQASGEGDLFKDVVDRHQRLASHDYHELKRGLHFGYERAGSLLDELGAHAARLHAQAIRELIWHPYDDPNDTLTLLQEAAAFGLRYELAERLFVPESPEKAERLVKIVQGELDPDQDDATERFMESTRTAVQAAAKYQSRAQKMTDVVKTATQWMEEVLASAATNPGLEGAKRADAVSDGLTFGARLISALEEQDATGAVTWTRTGIRLHQASTRKDIRLAQLSRNKIRASSAALTRIDDLISVFNVISLVDSIFSEDDVSLTEILGDLAGTVQGFETLYRVLSETAETELGVSLDRIAPLISVAVGFEETWGHVQAGKSSAVLLEGMGLGAAILATAHQLMGKPIPKRAALLLAIVGATGAVGAELVYTDDEKFLMKYNPDPAYDSTGPFGTSSGLLRKMTRDLDTIAVDQRMENRIGAVSQHGAKS